MRDILQEIVDNKRRELKIRKEQFPFRQMAERIETQQRSCRSMRQALADSPTGIIAEFKRRSPSKGWIKEGGDVVKIVSGYQTAGASGCSVLTDECYFGGTADDLLNVRPKVGLPLLRKEFIVDEYQLHEAVYLGADAVLLIAACLPEYKCFALAQLAHSLGLEVLLEIHSEAELEHLNPYVDMLGVNNRNLGTFHTDVNISFRLAEQMQRESNRFERQPLLVSESGLSSVETVKELRQAGFRGFLMGEAFMRTDDPARALSDFIDGLL